MKPLFGFDITEDKNSETYYADLFKTKSVDEEISKRLDDATNTIDSTVEKASVPTVLTIIQYLTFFYGVLVIGAMFGVDGGPKQAFENAPILSITGLIALIPAIVIWVYSKMKQKKVYAEENSEGQMKTLEDYAMEAFDNLGVPKDAKETDILLFRFRIKDGKVKMHTPTMASTPFYNHVFRVWRDGFTLYIADVASLYTFHPETFKTIRKIKKCAILPTWNKKEKYNKGEYKQYKLGSSNAGILAKPYYILVVEKDGEEYGIYFPCYELPTFEALTGLTATEEE